MKAQTLCTRGINAAGYKGSKFSTAKSKGKPGEKERWFITTFGERVENDNPADYYNTCLKMAAKRAQVSAVLTVTGASAVFTQDIEDLRSNIIEADFESGIPLDEDDLAAPQPTEEELWNELIDKSGLTDKADIAYLERFITETAATQDKPVIEMLAGSLNHFDSFKNAFTPWLARVQQSNSQKSPKKEAPDKSLLDQREGASITSDTLAAIRAELKRLGQPDDTLPKAAADIFGGDPGDLSEADGRSCLNYLKGM